MANLTLRLVKGVPLTNAEVDGNFSNLNITKAEIGRDLSGNIYYPVVSGIQGRDVDSTAPSDTQVLQWVTSSNAWVPSTITYDTLLNPPVANIILTGDVTGSANAVLTANSTIITISATTIQANSVALGTDTTGDYVANVLAGTGIVVTDQGGETASPTVALDVSGVTADTYGGSSKVPVLTIDQYGRVTSAANVNVAGVTSFASSGNSFTISTADGGSFTANIQQDSVRLGTDTTGNYVSTVTVGSGLTVSGSADEGNVVTVAHADTSSVSNVASDNSDGTVIQDVSLGFDTFGHVTSASVSTVNLDDRFLKLSNPSTQIVTSYVNFQGNVTFSGNVTTISANNLIIDDNFIYLNANNTSNNDDFGFVGNYNDGTYQHAGFFRDASDNGTWKIFDGYLPEPDAAVNIDTDNVSFRLANLAVNKLTANDIVSGNILPSANVSYNLGSPTQRFKDLYLSGSTIDLGGATLSASGENIQTQGIVANVITSNVFSGVISTDRGVENFVYGANAAPNIVGSENFIFGNCAGYSANSIAQNFIFGNKAGQCLTDVTGYYCGIPVAGAVGNFLAGYCAGANLTVQSHNVMIGFGSGMCGNSGTLGEPNQGYNTFIGYAAGAFYTGDYARCGRGNNVFLGRLAGAFGTGGANNTFIGEFAGYTNTSGCFNNFFGTETGFCNSSACHNTFIGYQAGYYNTTGSCNTFFGYTAGKNNTTGSNNNFLGYNAARCNTSGCDNIAIGRGAGYSNSEGSCNIFLGYNAGIDIFEGHNNIILGYLPGHTSPTSNLIVLSTGEIERLRVEKGNLSVQAGSGNVLASQGFFNNLIVKNVSEYVANTATFSTTTESTLFEFSKNVYSSGKFTITGKQGSNVQISEMLVAQDGTTASSTEYGVVKTSGVTVFTGNVDISGDNVRVRVIGGSAISTKYTLAGTLLDL